MPRITMTTTNDRLSRGLYALIVSVRTSSDTVFAAVALNVIPSSR